LKPERNIERRKITSKNKNPRYTLFVGKRKEKLELLPILLQTSLPQTTSHGVRRRWRRGRPESGRNGRVKDGKPRRASRHRGKVQKNSNILNFEHFLNLNFF
jgi:hypothetical protein